MSDRKPDSDHGTPDRVAAILRIDEICDRFEAALRAAQQPVLEDYLCQAPTDQQGTLRQHLTRLETEYRNPRKEAATEADYSKQQSKPATSTAAAQEAGSQTGQDEEPCAIVGESPNEIPQKIGRFRIRELLGAGGFGHVYKAYDPKLDRTIALKIPRSVFSTRQEEERFLREARSAAQLRHLGIVPVYETGQEDGLPYIVSECIEGPTLTERLRAEGYSCSEAAELVARVADALQYAHQQGVIHRDIKPGNILIDAEGQPHLADFGLARRDDGEKTLTETGQIVGTPAYMSPEQATGQQEKVGAQSDIYSLGVVLYELLTGRLSFQGEKLELLRRIVEDEPRSPRFWNPRVPRDLETITLKCLAKEPRHRYLSAGALAEDLYRWRAGEPIHGRPVSATERCWRWCRRRPVVAALTGSVGLLLVVIAVGALVTSWKLNAMLTRAQHAERQATRRERDARHSLWHSYVAQARAGRRSSVPGQRFDSLEAVRKAATMIPTVVVEEEDLLTLRNEAIACMALADIRVLPGTSIRGIARRGSVRFDAEFERYTTWDTQGKVTLWSTTSNHQLLELPGFGTEPRGTRFSPDGQFLAVSYRGDQCRIYHLDRQEVLLKTKVSKESVDFTPDSSMVAAGHRDGSIHFFDLTPREETETLPLGPLPYGIRHFFSLTPREETEALAPGPPPFRIRFDPAGRRLAVSSAEGQELRVWNIEDARLIWKIATPNGIGAIAWSPNGELLAAARGDNNVSVFDAESGRSQAVLRGHQGPVQDIDFSHDGDLLASWAWDNTSRLWSPTTGDQLLRTTLGELFQCSRFESRIAFRNRKQEAGILELATGSECRTLQAHVGDRGPWGVDISPDGRLMVSSGSDGVRLWNLVSLQQLTVSAIPIGYSRSAVFTASGEGLSTLGAHGLHLWPITRIVESNTLRVGPSTFLGKSWRDMTWSRVTQTGDGTRVAYVDDSAAIRILDLDNQTSEVIRDSRNEVKRVTISPDGKWVAAGRWDGVGFNIWDAHSGRLVKELQPGDGHAHVTFSPDSKWLITGAKRQFRCWEAGSWSLRYQIPVENGTMYHVAFTNDGKMVAIPWSNSVVKLVEASTGRELAKLEPAHRQPYIWMCFTPDATKLAVACSTHTIQLWDLRSIRAQLVDLGLDWDMPAYPPVQPEKPSEPLRLELMYGELAVAHSMEGEALLSTAHVTEGHLSRQEMTNFRGSTWSGDSQLFWSVDRPGARLTLNVNVPATGDFSVSAVFTKAGDFGQFQCYVNGRKLGEAFNGYSRQVFRTDEVALGTASLTSGDNEFVIEIVGKDDRSNGYRVGFDSLKLTSVTGNDDIR